MTHALLTTTLRNWLSNQAARPPIEGDIHRYMAAHRLGGLLYHIGASLSEPITHLAEKEWSNNTAGYLTRIQALQSRWPTSAKPPLLFKGADFVENLYGAPGARRSVDLDVLVTADEFKRVRRCFEDCQKRPDASYERLPSESDYADGFVVNGSLIELHHSIGPQHAHRLDERLIFERALSGTIAGFRVLYPHPEDRLLLWLHNQSKAGFTDGLWSLIDFALILNMLRDNLGHASMEDLRRVVRPHGLVNAFELSLSRLSVSGIYPSPIVVDDLGLADAVRRFCIHDDTPTRQASVLRRQVLKLWVCPPELRTAMFTRLVLTGVRRLARREIR